MIDPTWRRIAGLHVVDDGDIGVVWLAQDTTSDVVHLYDCCVFRREVLAVIAEGISARGRWIPVAWNKKAGDFADKLLNGGINMLPDGSVDSPSLIEVVSREVWLRMRTSRFRVDKTAAEWLEEYRTFYRDESQVPTEGYPLMAATRHAIEMLPYARRQSGVMKAKKNHPEVSIL